MVNILILAIHAHQIANADHSAYPLSTGIVVEPRSKSLVLNGYPGTVQFFHHATDTHVREVEVTPRNRMSRTEAKEIMHPHVHHVAFSQNGDWMATIDERPDRLLDTERYLHFWKFDHDQQTYALSFTEYL